MKYFFYILFLNCLSYVVSGQGGWTQAKGKYFTKIDFTSLGATNYYTPSGILFKTNTFNQNSINLYGEYGITNRLTAILNMPLLRINSFETSNSVAGIGDAKIELKYKLTSENQLPIAISIAPELPIGRSNAFAQNKENPLEKINLPTGDGEFNVWSTLAVSLPFASWAYSSYFGSYNFRTKYDGLNFQNQYQIGFELGVKPLENLWINAKLRSQYSVAESAHPELSFIRGDGTTYTLMSFEAFYKVSKRIGFSATFLTGNEWLASYRNLYLAPYFSIGFIYENK
ncbi:MAG: hypothetical protein RLZZ546_221 [Bacteroidota bacterium]|jgi:hypothetical protein